MWVEFFALLEDFSPGTPVFIPPENQSGYEPLNLENGLSVDSDF